MSGVDGFVIPWMRMDILVLLATMPDLLKVTVMFWVVLSDAH